MSAADAAEYGLVDEVLGGSTNGKTPKIAS
jgi:ATP-dependent protease ClpP protease subunit